MTNRFMLKRKDAIVIFSVAFTARLLWGLFSGLGPEAGADFERYDTLSTNILNGEPNLETKLFIVAPLFPYALSLAKLIFGTNWFAGLGGIQILISSVSVVCLGAAAGLIFERRSIAITAGLLYALCLPTLYYTHLPSQESLFQSFFVISFWALCWYNSTPNRKILALFSVFFTLALLTKSHVILMIPMACALILSQDTPIKRRLTDAVLYLTVIGLLTMPYGLYNLKANGTYVISSSGSGGFFLTGHNEDFYSYVIRTPPKESQEFKRLHAMNFQAYSESGIPKNATHKQRQQIYLRRGLNWISQYPGKALHLLGANLAHHFKPGYSLKFQSFRNWLLALAFNAPIYTLAYIELLKQLKHPRRHLPAYAVFSTMLLFVVIFYAQNRFRLITIEPIYILYAAPGCVGIAYWLQRRWQRGRIHAAS